MASLGHELYFLDASECTRLHAASYNCQFHENLCSYAKKLYEYFADSYDNYDLIIVPTSCDAMKKLFNALKESVPVDKIYLLDVPQNKDDAAANFLATEFEKLKKRVGVAA